MIERLEAIKQRYQNILDELMKPEVMSNIKETTKLAKEQKDLEEIVHAYNEYKQVLNDISGANEMLKDEELASMAREELVSLEDRKQNLETQIEILLIPKDENDDKNVIMEIRGAAGGDEANIFAGDLFRMYSKYVEKLGWGVEVVNASEANSGGFTGIEFIVKGSGAYSKLKYENGSHRVQRVPETETQGRVHTSTATVLVMPEIENIEVNINPNDLKIDVYHSSGAGGQSVNTTDSAVRITHLPTGIVVTCQNERSQLKNKAKAMSILQSKLYEKEKEEQDQALGSERRSKIGTGDRSEKIRTYNYPQNRVTDHRINESWMSLDKIMEGNLENIIESLITEDQTRKLKGE